MKPDCWERVETDAALLTGIKLTLRYAPEDAICNHKHLMKILQAVDGSEYTTRLVSYISNHLDIFGGDQRFTASYAVLPVPRRAAAFAYPELTRCYHEDDAEVVLGPIRRYIESHRIIAQLAHQAGHPAQLIADKATREHFDLLVMGSHGYGTFANLFLGSVVAKVLASCGVPVLLVR